MTAWHHLTTEETLGKLGCDRDGGLTEEEAGKRRQYYGPNELTERPGPGIGQLLWNQFWEPMVGLLIVAAAVSLAIHEYIDSIVILIIIVLNAGLGFFQDYRAEKAMAALKRLSTPQVKVRRDGSIHSFPASQLVPGDIIVLEAGDRVPADARLIETHTLYAAEAVLTGESHPTEKDAAATQTSDAPLADRTNMAYMGTEITTGNAEAVVTETGMITELGRIADMLQSVPRDRTPLQRRLARLGIWLALCALGIVTVVFVLGILRDEPVSVMIMTALSMAVAAVPEGLPAVATVALALGAKRMLKRNALIRRLPAVETLGSVTVICTDKTGTLTENRMRVETISLPGETFAAADLNQAEPSSPLSSHPALSLLLINGTLCNNAEIELQPDETTDTSTNELSIIGDPTEAALVATAALSGLNKEDLEKQLPRVSEAPFSSTRKRMTTVHRLTDSPLTPIASIWPQLLQSSPGARSIVFTKGAVDSLLSVSTSVWLHDHPEPLSPEQRDKLMAENDRLASEGERVLGMAFRLIANEPSDEETESLEQELVFIGMAGLVDPPRAEAREAVALCKSAGVRPIMITGDHPLTARCIAAHVGLDGTKEPKTGNDLAKESDYHLRQVVENTTVYARVAPSDKLRIVEALKQNGHIVAMTGDGVNDAPALKRADIGVAMGITGSDVSKDASEAVLLDDNFATIVHAIEEGRVIYDNVRKFLKYTLTSNGGEIWVMLLAPFLGMPLPLLPLQILWINLVTDGLPGLALAVEPGESNVMKRPPRPPKEPVINWSMGIDIIWVGLLMGGVSLATGWHYWSGNPTETYDTSWGTIIFTVLTLSQMGHALAVRSSRDSLFTIGLFSNKALVASVTLTLLMQLAVIYVPFLQHIFHTEALPMKDLFLCLALSTIVFWGVELQKFVARRLSP